MSRQLTGVAASGGTVTGPIAVMGGAVEVPPDTGNTDTTAAITEVHQAIAAVAADLTARAEAAGGDAQAVLEAHVMIVNDPTLEDEISTRIRQGHSAAWSVGEAFGFFRDQLVSAGAYLAERAADLDDLRSRVIAQLLGLPMPGLPSPDHPFILVARDLAPADTAMLDVANTLALVTEQGGPTSHTAILARSLGIPAIVACTGVTELLDGTTVIVDGDTGVVTVEPTLAELSAATKAQQAAASLEHVEGPGRTKDGYSIGLLANIGSAEDARKAAAAGADGVGLLRTEFLYLDATTPPTVDEQANAFEEVFTVFPGKKVVVRLLDAGADKPLRFLGLDAEENPALGIRGLRALRRVPSVLSGQLEAIDRAARRSDAEVWVMAPMVADVEDAQWFANAASGLSVAKVGVMIEIPSAALLAAPILEIVDFASIGTNDLTQYTLAADRLVGALATMQTPWHPAVLELIARTAQAGQSRGRPVGVCGEAASDPLLALVLVGMGITSLSMAPSVLAKVRDLLASTDMDRCADIAVAAQRESTPQAARTAAAKAQLGD